MTFWRENATLFYKFKTRKLNHLFVLSETPCFDVSLGISTFYDVLTVTLSLCDLQIYLLGHLPVLTCWLGHSTSGKWWLVFSFSMSLSSTCFPEHPSSGKVWQMFLWLKHNLWYGLPSGNLKNSSETIVKWHIVQRLKNNKAHDS